MSLFPTSSPGILISTNLNREQSAFNEFVEFYKGVHEEEADDDMRDRYEALSGQLDSLTLGEQVDIVAAADIATASEERLWKCAYHSLDYVRALQAEAELEARQARRRGARNLHRLETGVPCLVYIPLPERRRRLTWSSVRVARHCLAFYPAARVCHLDEVDDVLAAYLRDEQEGGHAPATAAFAVRAKARYAPPGLDRPAMTLRAAAAVSAVFPSWTVDLRNPTITLHLQIIKTTALIGLQPSESSKS
jgi:hypothetical protein